jgi:hypothetical protein
LYLMARNLVKETKVFFSSVDISFTVRVKNISNKGLKDIF